MQLAMLGLFSMSYSPGNIVYCNRHDYVQDLDKSGMLYRLRSVVFTERNDLAKGQGINSRCNGPTKNCLYRKW